MIPVSNTNSFSRKWSLSATLSAENNTIQKWSTLSAENDSCQQHCQQRITLYKNDQSIPVSNTNSVSNILGHLSVRNVPHLSANITCHSQEHFTVPPCPQHFTLHPCRQHIISNTILIYPDFSLKVNPAGNGRLIQLVYGKLTQLVM